ncbi:heterokaryon incompatibility [Pseudoneurospora amorphoporcata]|uniref:Heterokaryon incompatibility n=1 Tax=Pseudoneurospora amorphoporcata TaxID=241081 RepID=A0AAN6NMT9_9PEZI|nr:heterokaryon incompatibility [Pseudoneurospora amorphoporcata]
MWGVYEALSYTWGDPSNVRDITSFTPRMTPSPPRKSDSQGRGYKCPFEGAGFQQEGSYTTLTVTYNCYSALRRLRNHISPRTVWIDAICINQDDIPERNSQVAMMSLIYHQSRRLVIDVGDASPTSDAAIDFIVQYDQHRETGERDEHGVYDMTTGLFIRDIICEFYARPWFSRIWVLQEAFLGVQEPWTRDSHGLPAWLNCGGRSVEWSKFNRCT